MKRCAICYTQLVAGDVDTSCEHCGQTYHESCWSELGGCGTYGCEAVAVAAKPAPQNFVGQGWGYSKECPECERQIGASLLVCTCGARFPYADPMTLVDYRTHVIELADIRRAKTMLVTLFIATLTGVLAPISGTVAGLYARDKRELLAGANGTFLAIGYGSAAIALGYTVIAALLLVGL